MASTFSGISTALSSLRAQRQGLDVAGQNIANVNTEGYSRQRTEMTAVEGVSNVPTIWAKQDPVGTGVNVGDITRIRDELLEARVRTEHSHNAFLSGQHDVFENIQTVFKEPSDTGLQARMSSFWSDWQDLSNNPGDDAVRTKVIQQGGAVAGAINDANTQLNTIWKSARTAATSQIADINTATAEIASLNKGIMQAKVGGLPANELADRRDALVLKLADLAGATATLRESGAVDVSLFGSTLVSGTASRDLAPPGGANTLAERLAGNKVGVTFADNGQPAVVTRGELGSSLESMNTVVPKYATALNEVATALISNVNTIHTAGFDKTGAEGGPFFSGTDAGTVSMAITEPDEVAASTAANLRLDGGNADALGDLATSGTGPDVTYRQLVADLGVAAKSATLKAETQSTITADLDSSHESTSGVSLDEEMSNLLQYQRAYEAAAKLMNTIDSTLNTLINNTGR
ncbi:flagellar hook-associated protein FlgK [Cryptosporangium aurantiacum]|uniref:Flagellar hook-associated protein 1 n=1 Tax=Cryptosporangium aurantiacum TaxID=134849 RepID=A0A1M7R7E2_9ACTN|nr:flagellar hook-associated protein FlgK [Cryptosporangium aurantiacum]SHN41978.1 flagellar hook-associated protein 1 FlgK [Cryptosporangium aurantiacum]